MNEVRALRQQLSDGLQRPRHWHSNFHFSLILEGRGQIDCRSCGETHSLHSGDLLLLQAERAYAAQIDPGLWKALTILVPTELVRQLVGSAPLPHFVQGGIRDQRARAEFENLFQALDSDCRRLEQETLLMEWLLYLSEHHRDRSGNGGPGELVLRLQDHIRARARRPIPLLELAEVAGLSPFQTHRLFSRETGLPPYEFQNQVRLELARAELAEGRSGADIAAELGFADQSHFIRFFKKHTGLTPARAQRTAP